MLFLINVQHNNENTLVRISGTDSSLVARVAAWIRVVCREPDVSNIVNAARLPSLDILENETTVVPDHVEHGVHLTPVADRFVKHIYFSRAKKWAS